MERNSDSIEKLELTEMKILILISMTESMLTVLRKTSELFFLSFQLVHDILLTNTLDPGVMSAGTAPKRP